MGYEILLYIPNLIGYARLSLLVASLVYFERPWIFLCLYAVSVSLDAVDGIAARALKQTSAFGAWFDVLIDLISRGALWCFLSKWGYFMMMIEWLTFVCTHARGPGWKIPKEDFPAICKMVMANGFKTPIGTYTITGIFVLPLWLYGMTSGFLSDNFGLDLTIQYVVMVILCGGRVLGLITELFYIKEHVKGLLMEDSLKPSKG
ncbi:uncharacterized protein LOC128231295 isoform X2 [Mya arenaria]|uniref:uncharacterized protein LOC128231295 isoform X2 n=1 Tax=Mya arenaria TaxID=6604 RepID=UPI0022E6D0D1|nr:uncharacterized protein LOC128231295 isoform X2 [Mya arenaria]XP_052799890.1 uncharacterized protein LOC128231295 isoform X2 [Mya arenaria]